MISIKDIADRLLAKKTDFGQPYFTQAFSDELEPGQIDPLAQNLIGALFKDIRTAGFLPLKEVFHEPGDDLNQISANIAHQMIGLNQHLLDPTVRASDFIDLKKKEMGWDLATYRLPLLILYFGVPRPELHERFMADNRGYKLMQWLSIGDNHTFDLALLKNQTPERFTQLTQELFGAMRSTKQEAGALFQSIIVALGTINFQQFVEAGADVNVAGAAVKARLQAFMLATGMETKDAEDNSQFVIKMARYPYPHLWGTGPVRLKLQDFLGMPAKHIDNICDDNNRYGSLNKVDWWRSPLHLYFENNFFHCAQMAKAEMPHRFDSYLEFIDQLKQVSLKDRSLITPGMAYVLEGDSLNALHWQEQYETLVSKALCTRVRPPELNRPVMRYLIRQEGEFPDSLIRLYFEEAMKMGSSWYIAQNIFKQLSPAKPEVLNELFKVFLAGTPRDSDVRKIYAFLKNPSEHLNEFSENMRVHHLETELNL
jgi:hypothetical protein